MDTLTERAVRILLFVTGVLTLPAVSPAAAAALVDYQLPLGLLAPGPVGAANRVDRAGLGMNLACSPRQHCASRYQFCSK